MPTITIELTAQQATRLADAWEEEFAERPDVAAVKLHLIRHLKNIVIRGERKQAERESPPQSFDPT